MNRSTDARGKLTAESKSGFFLCDSLERPHFLRCLIFKLIDSISANERRSFAIRIEALVYRGHHALHQRRAIRSLHLRRFSASLLR